MFFELSRKKVSRKFSSSKNFQRESFSLESKKLSRKFHNSRTKTSEEKIENALRSNVVGCPVGALACFEYGQAPRVSDNDRSTCESDKGRKYTLTLRLYDDCFNFSIDVFL